MSTSPRNGAPDGILIGSPSEVLKRAAAHFDREEYSAAAAICREVVARDPDNAEAFYILGHIATLTGDRESALGYFARAVSLAPTERRYGRSFALALETSGQTDRALLAWQQFLSLTPDDPDALCRYARLLSLTGRHQDALAAYERAAAFEETGPDTRLAHALAHHRAGALSAAIEIYEALLADRPDWAACHNGLAASLHAAGNHSRAIGHARRATELAPGSAEFENNLGLALLGAGRISEASVSLTRATRLRPDDAEIQNNLGVCLARLGDRDGARNCFTKTLALRPGWAEGLLNFANLLRQEDRLTEAVAHYRQAIEAGPDNYRPYGSLALALLDMNDASGAIASYEKAIALAPDDPELRKGLGIAQLLAGNLQDGWQNYEWRLRGENARLYEGRQWNGEDLADKSILVHSEQGFGDTLQFCRYLSILKGRTAAREIVFECQRPLVRLLAKIDGADKVVARGDVLPLTDYYVPLLSLPGLFSTELETIPARVPYIDPPAKNRRNLQGISETEGRRIGIVWKGNPQRQDDEKRSAPLSAFAPLLALPDVAVASLQTDLTAEESNWLEARNVTDLSTEITDFSDTAALIAELDLVVSVDTATAHLAGALNRPVWVVLGMGADWRYLTARDDSPWYPSMRLFRQHRRGDWQETVERLCRELTKNPGP